MLSSQKQSVDHLSLVGRNSLRFLQHAMVHGTSFSLHSRLGNFVLSRLMKESRFGEIFYSLAPCLQREKSVSENEVE